MKNFGISETMISAAESDEVRRRLEPIQCRIEMDTFLNLEDYKRYTCGQCYE